MVDGPFTLANVGDTREWNIPDDSQVIVVFQLDAGTAGDVFAPEVTLNGVDWLALPVSPNPAGGAQVTAIGPAAGAWATGNASTMARVRLRKTVDGSGGAGANTQVTTKITRTTTSLGSGSFSHL